METLWEFMKKRWTIRKYQIKDLGINPDKEVGKTTLDELYSLAAYLDMTVGELIEY